MQNAILPRRTAPAIERSPALTVREAVGPDGHLELLAVERIGDGPEHEWSRFATDGSRSILFASGRFRIGHWQPFEERVAGLIASRPAEWHSPHLRIEARAAYRRARSWEGPDARALADFEGTCGPGTLAISCAGMDPTFLDGWDAGRGRQELETALARLPALAAAMRASTDAGDDDARQACERLLEGPPGIDGTCALLLPLLERRFARLAEEFQGIPDRLSPAQSGEAGRTNLRLAIRRMAGVPANPDDALLALSVCHLAPRDWAPGTAEGIEAMASVMRAALALGPALDTLGLGTLIAPVEGGWEAARRSLADEGAENAADLAKGCADMAAAYMDQVLKPAAANVGRRTGTRVDLPGDAAIRALFAGKGIMAIARASRKWHRYAPYINTVVSDLAGIHAQAWPSPCPDFVASNGLVLVPLTSVRELVEEGARQGHCVGSYGPRVSTGNAAIMSVRAGDGEVRSTLLVQGSQVTEHKGRRNSAPDVEDRKAAAEFVASLPEGGIRPGRRRARGTGFLRGIARVLNRIASPTWTGRYAYDPYDPMNVAKVTGAWGGLVPRRSRGSMEALLAGTHPPGAPGVAPDGTPAIKSRPALKAARMVLWTGESFLTNVHPALWMLVTFSLFIVGLYNLDRTVDGVARDVRRALSDAAATSHAEYVEAKAHALCGDKAPFLKACPLRTPIPLPAPPALDGR